MDRLQQAVGGRGQDREALQRCAVRSIPAIPDPGQGHRGACLHTDKVGHLLVSGFGPFIETAGRDQAAPGTDRLPEGRLLMNRLATGVNQPGADGRVLGPMWDQPPAGHGQLTCSFAGWLDNRGQLGGRDIPVLEDRRHL